MTLDNHRPKGKSTGRPSKKAITVHDVRFADYVERPKTIPGKIEPTAAVVPDPYDGKPLGVYKNAKLNVFIKWRNKGSIDASEFAAAEEFCRLLDRVRSDGNIAVDLSKPFVDTTFNPHNCDSWPLSRQTAFSRLNAARDEIGTRLMARLISIGEGMEMEEAANKHHFHTAHEIKLFSSSCKDGLRQLVDLWGMKTGK